MTSDRRGQMSNKWSKGQLYQIIFGLLIVIVAFNCFPLVQCEDNNANNDDVFELGVGIADITGPAADVGMMGYAKGDQETQGIHFRLYSRAFIIHKPNQARVVYVNCDMAMISTAVKTEVVARLQQMFGNIYTEDNIMISATHTHAAPGGFLQYVLYIISTQGFNKQNFLIIVSGIVRSIERAHKTIKQGRLKFVEGSLDNANINRSPSGYAANPAPEKARFERNTDSLMQILRFEHLDGTPMGMINWFPVHCTSMNNTNKLISGDNKGYASLLFEQYMNPRHLPGKGAFVAAFANANEGDVSPNTAGARCINTGMSCDIHTSTCPDLRYRADMPISPMQHDTVIKASSNERCVASGPGKDMFESTRIIGQMQFEKAKQLFENTSAHKKVSGPIHYIHQYADFSNQHIYNDKGQVYATTCPPAMGYSFAAGTTDGPGAFDFKQGATSSTPFWNLIRDFIRRPSPQLIRCQHPKPILLASGEMKFPYAWQPTIIPLQLISIGPLKPASDQISLLFAGLPGEFTTMSGRRVRTLLQSIMDSSVEESSAHVNYQANMMSSLVQNKDKHKGPQVSALKSDTISARAMKPVYLPKHHVGHLLNERLHRNEHKVPMVRSRRWDQPPTIRFTDQAPVENSLNSTSGDTIQAAPSEIPNVNVDTVPAPSVLLQNQNQFISAPISNESRHKIVLAGLANAYSSYVTTYEEYQVQRYEAASTIYGPYTLHAYLQNYRMLGTWLQKLRNGQQLPKSRHDFDLKPPNLLSKQLQLKPGVVYDGTKIGTKFGDVVLDVHPIYHPGDQVQVVFRSGHPQNWPGIESTYLTVEYLDESKQRWIIVATDANWETKYIWNRTNFVMGESMSIIIWDIPANIKAGTYRIRHFGASKNLFQRITPYIGISSSFQVTP